MEEKINKRLQELSSELEKLMNDRQKRLDELRAMDMRIKEVSAVLIELKKLLDQA